MQLAGSNWRRPALILAALLLVAHSPDPAVAQFTFYTDQSAFADAVGSYTVEDFEDLRAAPGFGRPTTDGGYVDDGLGHDQVRRSGDDTQFYFLFDVGAFGAFWDMTPLGPGLGLELTILTGAGPVLVPRQIPNTYTGGFWGFTSTLPFTQVDIRAGTQRDDHVETETYTLDDLHFAAWSEPEIVPEPATLLLLASGLAGVAALAVRRRNRGLNPDSRIQRPPSR
jgi:hypothetical protein